MNEKYQIAVIGSGSGGSEAALLAAKKGFKVAVIESGALGFIMDPLRCALHASARLHGEFFKGKKFGVEADLFTDSLMQWMKAQRAASIRLAQRLQKNLEELNAVN
jgi:dihydrolipoamide dehydrogenase